jgi:diguanylate cyclase (GGDEF)-like protein
LKATANILGALSTSKYERLLPRIFPGATRFEIRDQHNDLFWSHNVLLAKADKQKNAIASKNHEERWQDIGSKMRRRQMPCGEVQFCTDLLSRTHGRFATLIVAYNNKNCTPLQIAADLLRRAFTDAAVFLREEVELQSECNQLAVELTERYEELNLVYATKDQVEYFEEGHEALTRLVNNCADYLDVGMAALICRDRNLTLQHVSPAVSPVDIDKVIERLSNEVYNRVESQVASLVLNEDDDEARSVLFSGCAENLIAQPILDDHGSTIGVLAVVARPDLHTFSNGDRNLLEVMAKKASRIIHTHHDSLTGMMNRNGFESSMVTTLSNARSNNTQHCLLHIDIDQLHVINDLMGYPEGDNLIRRVAKILKKLLRESDFIARLGGDEFGALLCNCTPHHAYDIATKICEAIRKLTVTSARRQLEVSVSMGLAALNRESDGIVGVMAAAEIACKTAKEAGRDRIQVFEQDNTTLIRRSEEIEWIGRIQEALREDQFALYCQPVVPVKNKGESVHFEILLRMIGDDGKIISPGLFMPAAERYQLMPMIDRWVIRNAIADLKKNWRRISASKPVFCLNLSGQSLTNVGFQSFVVDGIRQSNIPPQNVCFEITETAAISNIDEAILFMNAIKQLGCRFALDDFGAGLSSFGYLKVLPVDYLKIDGSFVREMTLDPVSLSMVRAIYQIGQTMGLSTIAEFVENQETADLLRDIGVDYLQGYGIGKPVPMQQIVESLRLQTSAATA